MKKEIIKRIITSIILLFALIFMFLNSLFLLFIILISSILSFIEFSKMISIIKKKDRYLQLSYNIIFFIYIFMIATIFVIASMNINIKIFIFIVLLTCVSSDIGGLIFGRLFKGPKLTKLSPNKTYAGSFGSIVFSILTSMSIYFYFAGEIFFYSLLLGLIVSISTQLGDLFFSYLKRQSKLKDTGNLLPGHGGVLDRIDGILLAVPVGLLFSLLIN
jgi:phosphatidate cytidylyltransferase